MVRYFAMPIKESEDTLWLAVESNNNIEAFETFTFLFDKFIEPVMVDREELKGLLQQLQPEGQNYLYEELSDSNVDEDSTNSAMTHDEPMTRLLDSIFNQALEYKASDIHFEPQAQGMRLRFRVDGVLQRIQQFNLGTAKRLVSRMKLLAKLDIAQTRLPQDGAFQFQTSFDERLDFRMSTLPTQFGEKVVLRVQYNKPINFKFHELGMTDQQVQQLKRALQYPQGLILVTGPTGSGKSITLYSALNYLNHPGRNIMTAEDPIEIALEGVTQSQLNRAVGLGFSELLRTFLRQDPDIIMLGEIRDEESAQMALRAAQTGHLVLSTLHTNDASSAIERLKQLGIPEYSIHSSVLLVIAQRLLRRCCPHCNGIEHTVKGKFAQQTSQLLQVEESVLTSEKGCERCQQGYAGRVGIYQFLSAQKEKRTSETEQVTFSLDYMSLNDSAGLKVIEGVSDKDEVQRVLGEV